MSDNPLRALPAVDGLLRHPHLREAQAPQPLRAEAARSVIAEAREQVRQGGEVPSLDALARAAAQQLAADAHQRLGRVINATGVVLHTNLGRSPISARALKAVCEVAGGYSNLEYDVAAGARGSRHAHCAAALCRLSGAQDALVVNNNAAAILLVLSALAHGRDVVLSRGELIEIGGSFRIPDVMEQSGCTLREVGSTNRTRLADYQAAVGERTAALLKVHTSNYKVIGFTESVSGRALAGLAHEQGILCIEDLGSGALYPTETVGLAHEPTLAEAVAAGVDVITASGDKLLGGPQAGLIVGRAPLIEACRRHPLARAMRVDKMTLAALAETLDAYVEQRVDDIPVWRMLSLSAAELEARARAFAARVPAALGAEARAARSAVGGGSLPGEELPTFVVSIRLAGCAAQELAARLREGTPPIIGRVVEDALAFDLRTVSTEEEPQLLAALEALCT